MDELTSFERRLAVALQQHAGPRRPVDAIAIATRVRTTPAARRWGTIGRDRRGISALRLVAAIVAIALAASLIVLGVGSQPAPTPAPTPAQGITAISAGGRHTCAVVDGRAWCWGDNRYGQHGNGRRPSKRDEPTLVSGLEGVTAVAAGGHRTCALASARVWCWGRPKGPQTDPGTNALLTGSRVPELVEGLEGVSAISAGDGHACALVDGRVWCWGANLPYGGQIDGRLGDETIHSSDAPLLIEGVDGVTAISTGTHNCAVTSGRVWCWGGRQGVPGSGTPRRVDGIDGVTAVSSGDGFDCAISQGLAWCWGENWQGQLGNGSTSEVSEPLPRAVPGLRGVTAVSARGQSTCAVAAARAWCWGQDAESAKPIAAPISGLDEVTAVTTSGAFGHTCAVSEGQAWCWGANQKGQLGDGTRVERSTPVLVEGLGDPVEAAAPSPRPTP